MTKEVRVFLWIALGIAAVYSGLLMFCACFVFGLTDTIFVPSTIAPDPDGLFASSVLSAGIVLFFTGTALPILLAIAIRRRNWWVAGIVSGTAFGHLVLYVCLSLYYDLLSKCHEIWRWYDGTSPLPTTESEIAATPWILRIFYAPFLQLMSRGAGLGQVLVYCALWGLLLTVVLEVFIFLYRKRLSRGRNANGLNS